MHDFHNIGRGDRSGIGKTIQERSDAKEMVAVAVGDIDRCQVLADLAATQSTGGRACWTVRKASARTASRSP